MIIYVNKPVLFTNIQQIKKLGLSDTGTISMVLRSIYNQTSTLVVVVKIADAVDKNGTAKIEDTIKMQQKMLQAIQVFML